MKYLIDAQLPKRLCKLLLELEYDTVHTLDLSSKNRTKDKEINNISIKERRVVVSKDTDFIESLLVSDKPYKLLYVSTGNISNKALQHVFIHNIQQLSDLFKNHRLIELTSETIIVHY